MKNACTINGRIKKKTSAIAMANDSAVSATDFAVLLSCLIKAYLIPNRTATMISTFHHSRFASDSIIEFKFIWRFVSP